MPTHDPLARLNDSNWMFDANRLIRFDSNEINVRLESNKIGVKCGAVLMFEVEVKVGICLL